MITMTMILGTHVINKAGMTVANAVTRYTIGLKFILSSPFQLFMNSLYHSICAFGRYLL